MGELERRLTRVLTEASASVDPAVARLRNPAVVSSPGRSKEPSPRWRSGWVAAGSAVAVAAVVAAVIVGGPLLSRPDTEQRSSEASPSAPRTRGTADGVAPLWSLTVADVRQRTVAQLPVGGPVPLPRPYAVDPRALAPEAKAGSVPWLVTAAGTIRFQDAKSVLLLAQRQQGTFVALLSPGHVGQDGMYDERLVVVGPNKVPRELFRAAQVENFAVSPDGTTVAVSVPASGAGGQTGPGTVLVDVGTARVTHRLEGRFTGSVWASESTLLLQGAKSLVWRAPWTGAGDRQMAADNDPTTTKASGSGAVSVAGGIVAVDQTGCLQRLGEDGKVNAANCGGWTLAGPVSPDGRYIPLEWPAADGALARGVLDVMENKVMPWPIRGVNPSWLGPADVLLREANVQDSPATVRCDLTSGTCVRVPDELLQGTSRGASWIGK